jgi:hypothetical protein
MPAKQKLPITIRAAILTIVGGGIFVIIGSILTPFVQHYLESPTIESVSEKTQAEDLYADAQNWSIVLFDTFSNNNANWFVGQSADEFGDANHNILSGKYYWWIKANSYGGQRMIMAPAISSNDIYVAVDAKFDSAPNATVYGIAFRIQGQHQDQYYQIRVYSEKNAAQIKYRDKATETWETIAYLPNIGVDERGWNRIAVIAKGSNYWFFINGKFIYPMHDDRLSGGKVGLIAAVENVGDEANIEFDNFEYRSTP